MKLALDASVLLTVFNQEPGGVRGSSGRRAAAETGFSLSWNLFRRLLCRLIATRLREIDEKVIS
ncbi:MAG TPA: hypothetical protein VEW48_03120 [Thermoanaerobaculia bacterium]|nr:hypothetical protein [Thermoanaerobaculia bacterium]